MPTFTTELLVIDQAPLLGDALDECQRACRQFEELRTALEQHEVHDLPAFDRWNRATFAALIGEVENLSGMVREREVVLARLRKLHWATFFGSSSAVHIETGMGFDDEDMASGFSGGFASWRDSRRVASEDLEGDHEDSDEGIDPELRDFSHKDSEEEEGDDPDRDFIFEDLDSDGGYTEFFVRGGERRQGAYRARARQGDDRFRPNLDSRARDDCRFHGQGAKNGSEPLRGKVEGEGVLARLKERYRLLVRRLHPDLNPDVTAEQKRLWNQVQVAYREKDLEQLDLLLALSDALRGRVSSETGLYQLRRAAAEIRRSIASLARKLESARCHRAWKFAALGDRSKLEYEIERDLNREIQVLQRNLAEIAAQMARLSKKAAAPERSAYLIKGEAEA